MQYRTFGPLEWRPSALGFGAMRLPTLNGDPSKIDTRLATRMIRTAIDRGVNYVDTAWPYHKEQSEPFIGRCLQDGYRDRVKLATKLPTWLVNDRADFDRYLVQQMERLRTDHIDFYLLHGLNAARWQQMQSLGALEWAEAEIAHGRIGHLGFSFHDNLDVFIEIVNAYDWTFCQIMYNYMDVEFQAGEKGLRYAADRGLAVVVMEPLRGGSLTRTPPEPVAQPWSSVWRQRTPADWALQWVWNHPQVSLALSGMSAMSHVEENLDSADRSGIDTLSKDELAVIAQVRDAYRARSPVPCTDCKYCMPCPSGVAIPRIFRLYNDAQMYADMQSARTSYNRFLQPEHRADQCVACGQCERSCPQQIEIVQWLKRIHEELLEPASS